MLDTDYGSWTTILDDLNSVCCALKTMAMLEFTTFTRAVTEIFGQAKPCAEDWLDELALRDGLPGRRTCEWRLVTVAALARLTIRMTVDLQHASSTNISINTKVLTTPSSNCAATTTVV